MRASPPCKIIGCAIASLLVIGQIAFAETHVVSVGQSLQAAIDAATAGDTILVETGDYAEDLTIGKALTITAAPQQAVTSLATCTIADVPSGTVKLRGIQFNSLNASNSIVDIVQCALNGTLSCDNTTLDTIQTSVNSIVTLSGGCTFGLYYGTFYTVRIQDGGSGEIVGCTIDTRSTMLNGVTCTGGVSLALRNSYFVGSPGGSNATWPDGTTSCARGVHLAGSTPNSVRVTNCMFNKFLGYWNDHPYSRPGYQIYVNGSSTAAIRGCWFTGYGKLTYNRYGIAVYGTAVCVTLTHCYFAVASSTTSGGVVKRDCLVGVDSSECVDAGPPGDLYLDHDGSRNDIGRYGGHRYDPDGATTPNPVVLRSTPSAVYITPGEPLTIRAKAAVAEQLE